MIMLKASESSLIPHLYTHVRPTYVYSVVLAFLPMFVAAFIQCVVFNKQEPLWCAKDHTLCKQSSNETNQQKLLPPHRACVSSRARDMQTHRYPVLWWKLWELHINHRAEQRGERSLHLARPGMTALRVSLQSWAKGWRVWGCKEGARHPKDAAARAGPPTRAL